MIATLLAYFLTQLPPPPPPASGGGVTLPVLIEKHEPVYSDEGRQARVNGAVRLRIVVGEDGVPRDLRIERGLGFGLDEAAIDAVRTWRFLPASRGGHTQWAYSTIDVSFRLLSGERDPWHLGNVMVEVPNGAARPRLTNAVFPKVPAGPDVAIAFDIDENGVPTNLTPLQPGSSPAETPVLDALKQWRFTPARRDAYALQVHASFTFTSTGAAPSRPAPPPSPAGSQAGVTPPRLLSKVEPTYTEEARKVKLAGKVQVEGMVSISGVATELKIRRSLGLGLDEQAIRAVEQWRFSPANKDGSPIARFLTIEVNFVLTGNEALRWRLTRATFDTPPGVERPMLTKSEYPKHGPGHHINVALSFDIDEHGEPKNLDVDKSVDSEPEQQIIETVKKWRFKPATKDGKAVAARATFEFYGAPGK